MCFPTGVWNSRGDYRKPSVDTSHGHDDALQSNDGVAINEGSKKEDKVFSDRYNCISTFYEEINQARD